MEFCVINTDRKLINLGASQPGLMWMRPQISQSDPKSPDFWSGYKYYLKLLNHFKFTHLGHIHLGCATPLDPHL